MGWLSSLFSSDSNRRTAGKGQIFTSTHEAFSLPTSSPVFASHPDAFNPDALSTPDPESARSPASYTYPPQGSNQYGYIPSNNGFASRHNSLLPTHMDTLHTPFPPHANYPPLSKTWARLRSWLSREYPELGDTLNYGILPQDLADIESHFGFALPPVVRESYLCVDGQEAESAAGCSEGLFFGLTLLPLETVLEEWKFWREVDNDPRTGANGRLRQVMQSIPPGWVRREYSQRGWIPLVADKAGNYIGVDLNPAEGGAVGQTIVFGRDFDTKVVLWKGDGLTGWAKWLASFVEELESGEGFEIGRGDTSEGSEDDLGYESYFYDGSGRGQGDGGGDTGSGGGLRYTNEYRGWNVLEAWADRSMRKWHQAGVISDEVMIPAEEINKKPEETLDVDIAEVAQLGPGSEIPIPVLSNSSDHIPSPTVAAVNNHTRGNSKAQTPTHVPGVSLSKLPAPRPVDLPTAQDIAPLTSIPDQEELSLDDDLESGHGAPSEDIGLVTAGRRHGKSNRREATDASQSALLETPCHSPPPSSHPTPIKPTRIIPDLLTGRTPNSDDLPLVETDQVISPETTTQQNVQSLVPEDEEVAEDELPPGASIKLVGGGGQSGVLVSTVDDDLISSEIEEPHLISAELVSEVGPESTPASTVSEQQTHKKSKSSLASLKRISQLGSSRKKSSVSSPKEAVNPPPIK